MTEPKKIKIKKKEEQPFGMEKLRRLAEESRSFEEYMEKVIPELLEIKDEKDGGDNSIQAVYRRIVKELSENYVDSASQSHMSEKQLYNIVTSAVNDQGGQPSSKLIGMVSNTRNQVRNLPKREDLYILCFAIVACGGTVDQCDRLARAGVSEEIHSRELYQLDAKEGFFRFVLYWNQRCLFESNQKPMIKTRMITYSQACEIFDDKVSSRLREKIDDELKELESLLVRDDTESTIIPELMELLKALQTSIEKSNTDLPEKSDTLLKDYWELSEQITNALPQLVSMRNSAFSEDKEQRDLLSELITQLQTMSVFIKKSCNELSSAIALHQDKYRSFSDEIAKMLNTLENYLNLGNLDYSKKRDSLSELIKYIETIKSIIKDGRSELSKNAILLWKKYKQISEEMEKNLKGVCTLLFRINVKDGERTTFLSEFLKYLQKLRTDVERESKSARTGLATSNGLKKGCKSVSSKIDTDIRKIQFILDLMKNLEKVKSSEEDCSMDTSHAGKILQNIRKRYSRGEEIDNPSDHQSLTTSMQHNTSAWVSEVEKLVESLDLDQESSFEDACEVYTDMAGNFVRDKDWTAVSIILQAMCSERYKVNSRYYLIGKPTIKPKKITKENSEDSENNPNQFQRENKNAKDSKGDEGKQFIITDTPDFRVSRAILPEKVISKKVKGTIGRLVNPKIRFLSIGEDTEKEEQEDEDLLIPDESIKGDQSESVTKLVSMCGLLTSNSSVELNGVVSTTTRKTLLRFAIACNFTAESDYEKILGLSGRNQFIPTSKRENFVLAIIVWIAKKYTAENYVKYSVLETVKYAEIILLYYFAKKRNEEKNSDVLSDKEIYSKIAVYDPSYYDAFIYFYSLVDCFINLTKSTSSDSNNVNPYPNLRSGYEITLPFISDNDGYFTTLQKKANLINESDWLDLREFIHQTIEELICLFTVFRKNFEGQLEKTSFTLDMEQYFLCSKVHNFCEELNTFLCNNPEKFKETIGLVNDLLAETKLLDKLYNSVIYSNYTSDETEDNS